MTKQMHNFRRPYKAQQCAYGQEERSETYTQPKATDYPPIKTGSEIKATYRLEALTESQQKSKNQETQPSNNAHSGNGGITITTGHKIQQHR